LGCSGVLQEQEKKNEIPCLFHTNQLMWPVG
jgi:hypothetical protein